MFFFINTLNFTLKFVNYILLLHVSFLIVIFFFKKIFEKLNLYMYFYFMLYIKKYK